MTGNEPRPRQELFEGWRGRPRASAFEPRSCPELDGADTGQPIPIRRHVHVTLWCAGAVRDDRGIVSATPARRGCDRPCRSGLVQEGQGARTPRDGRNWPSGPASVPVSSHLDTDVPPGFARKCMTRPSREITRSSLASQLWRIRSPDRRTPRSALQRYGRSVSDRLRLSGLGCVQFWTSHCLCESHFRVDSCLERRADDLPRPSTRRSLHVRDLSRRLPRPRRVRPPDRRRPGKST